MYLAKLFFSSIIIITLAINGNSQSINWVEWDEAVELSKVDEKKVLIDVYTEWCKWCKKMEETTFQDSAIIDYVNEHFHCVRFDAEYKQDLSYNGKTYKYVKNGKKGYHELAKELLRGRMSYPTTVFLDEKLSLIQPIKGYQSVETYDQIIHYFNENHYRKIPWKKFSLLFNSNKLHKAKPIMVQPVKQH